MIENELGELQGGLNRFERLLLPRRKFEAAGEELRRVLKIAYRIGFLAVIILIVLGIAALLLNDRVLGFANISFSLVLAGLLDYYRRSDIDFESIKLWGMVATGVFFLFIAFFSGVRRPTILWSYLYPLAVFAFLGTRRGTAAVLIFFSAALCMFLLDPFVPAMAHHSAGLKFLFSASFLLVSAMSYFYEDQREKYQARLDTANAGLRRSNEEMEQRIRERTMELALSEEKYRAIIENMEEGYIELDLSGRITFANEAARDFLGYGPEEITGLHYKKYMDENNSQRVFKLYHEVFTTRIPKMDFEWEVIRKDGIRRTISGSASLICDGQGEPAGFRGFFRDNTERKNLQDRLIRAEKMEVLGRLAGGVAHDLNNVLGVLVGYSELLKDSLPAGGVSRNYAERILNSGVKGAAIIQDLLTLARRGVSVSQVVNLNSLARDFLGSPEFEKMKGHNPGVTINADLQDDLLNVKGSPVHLGKTFMNLVSNAIEAISGRGEVTIRTENRYLDKPIKGYDEMKEGDYAVLSIADTGVGISPDDLGKIFEPFYTKKVMGRSGTGLGLAVVWGTVKDHDGYIDVRSESGKGSTFTLYLPVTREQETPMKSETLSSYMSRGESILVVDDIGEQRDLAMNMLGRLGYTVSSAASGEEAVEYLKGGKSADLIVLDMIMDPGIDGMETYKRILEINPSQKAIIVSGYSETHRVRKGQQMGAGSFVRKPYILEKIGLAVRKELDRTR